MRARLLCLLIASAIAGACRHVAPPILRFAPPGTDHTRLQRDFALTDTERLALTPENIRALTQEQVDQVYIRLTAGPIGDGPYRGDLFFPRDADGHARISDFAGPLPSVLGNIALLRVEDLGRALWKGKVFFRSQGVLRNRIDDLAISETESFPTPAPSRS